MNSLEKETRKFFQKHPLGFPKSDREIKVRFRMIVTKGILQHEGVGMDGYLVKPKFLWRND